MNGELTNIVPQKVRECFVLVCLTGVRFSDAAITPDNIVTSQLLFTTEKTDTDLVNPMSAPVTELLARYDNHIPKYPAQCFNKIIKVVCAKVPSMNYNIPVKSYTGKNRATRSHAEKHAVISAHAGRRTFINLALEKVSALSPSPAWLDTRVWS